MKRILLVDDDDALRSALADVLRDEDYEVLEAADGQIARECLEGGAHVDAIILDVMMPRMNGVQFRSWQIGSAYSKIPVVIATAATHPPAELHKPPLAGELMVRKPFDLDALLAELSKILARS